jgi:2-methylisocitrate lyase-like PEP mutase family enzyme
MAANALARTLKSLHIPSKPIVFANIWDLASANAVLSLNSATDKPVKAVATASWAIAATLGVQDQELTLDQNLDAIRKIAPAVTKAGLPLSVDLQDGYGSRIEEVVAAAVKAGAHGANIEDSIPSAGYDKGINGSLYSLEKQVQRLKSALKAAADAGCPDFTLNARTDVFILGDSADLDDETRLREAVKRGKAYLEAGATTVFVWGLPPRGLRDAEIQTLVKEFDGRLAVILSGKSAADMAKMGVARISVGPILFLGAMETVKKSALAILQGGELQVHI